MENNQRRPRPPSTGTEGRRRLLLVLVAMQLTLSLLVLAEFLTYHLLGYTSVPWDIVELFEIGEVVFVFLSIAVGVAMVLMLLRRTEHVETHLKAASGAMDELMTQRFEEWQLSPAEAEVARFAIKGMTISEIAELRGTSEGTIKAQNNAVYRKAGVNSRAQLLGLFVEELIGGPLIIERAPVEISYNVARTGPDAQAGSRSADAGNIRPVMR